MEIGYETNKGSQPEAMIKNVTFDGVTVLNNFHKPVISIHNGDDAAVEQITFRNIVVEHEEVGSGDGADMPYLIDIAILQNSNWSTTKERGTIRDIVLENISFLEGNKNSCRITGYDDTHRVENIKIRNMSLFGKEVHSLAEGRIEADSKTISDLVIE